MNNESDNKPVAWQWLDTGHFRKKIPASAVNPDHWRPLYAAPERPLTEEQIDNVIEDARASLMRYIYGSPRGNQITQFDGLEAHVVRATERAHGIKSAPKVCK